jgi:hypothetical protein
LRRQADRCAAMPPAPRYVRPRARHTSL